MSKIANNDIARAIYLSTAGKTGADLSSAIKNATHFLANRRLMSKSNEILHLVQKIINKEKGIVVAVVSSAEKLSHKTKDELMSFFKKRYKAEEVILEEKLDSSLLGGMRIEINDEVLDLTIKNKIGQLQEYLARQ
ncbi:MAG: F0F1 ATP synthase subunit delta [Candidatus Pacebacteria bacterium]|nr:F0F1 ATP synthase subunit delta [Candidatus Paceibacterota bacterium]